MRQTLTGLAVGVIICLVASVRCSRTNDQTAVSVTSDTVTIRDTVILSVPKPVYTTVIRRDTVRITDTAVVVLPDSSVIIPVVRKSYKSEDYMAVVEGYKPRLVSIELYPKTTTVTNTVFKTVRPRWAFTIGPGVGYGPNGIQPYIGVTVGYVLWSR